MKKESGRYFYRLSTLNLRLKVGIKTAGKPCYNEQYKERITATSHGILPLRRNGGAMTNLNHINDYKEAANSTYKVLENFTVEIISNYLREYPQATPEEVSNYAIETVKEAGQKGREVLERLALSYEIIRSN